MWTQSFNKFFPGSGKRNQAGWEVYWRMLVTPNLAITPGLQVVCNPSSTPV
ncbi:MAG TPA: carbohydrate porin [Rubrivivax sp.]|nr:carbohydrate porin [Rubrivivax sp.]